MSAFFTNSLSVVNYDEFKKLFYSSLAAQVERVARLSEIRRSDWVKALRAQSSELDNLKLGDDFQLDYQRFIVWLLNLGEGLRSSSVTESYKKLAGHAFLNRTLTLSQVFNLFSVAYAETLLQKGSQIIGNAAFSFNADDIRETESRVGDTPKISLLRKQELILHMEYFYFIGENRTSSDHDMQKKVFLRRYFSALETYRDLLPPQSIENEFKGFYET